MLPSRAQKRWSPRLRTAGALLLLIGVVALVDRVLPGANASWGVLAPAVQISLGAGALAVGAALFLVGRRWR
ncbi:MAG TPA: hypothetical protein VFF06_16980 [Polyangia bacterium]|nr:hypothetical protein [Polyangia bacterium]